MLPVLERELSSNQKTFDVWCRKMNELQQALADEDLKFREELRKAVAEAPLDRVDLVVESMARARRGRFREITDAHRPADEPYLMGYKWPASQLSSEEMRRLSIISYRTKTPITRLLRKAVEAFCDLLVPRKVGEGGEVETAVVGESAEAPTPVIPSTGGN